MYRHLLAGCTPPGGDHLGFRARHPAAQRVLDIPGLEVLQESGQQFIQKIVSFYAHSSAAANDSYVYQSKEENSFRFQRSSIESD